MGWNHQLDHHLGNRFFNFFPTILSNPRETTPQNAVNDRFANVSRKHLQPSLPEVPIRPILGPLGCFEGTSLILDGFKMYENLPTWYLQYTNTWFVFVRTWWLVHCWLVGWLIDWLIGWLVYWLVDCLIVCLFGWFTADNENDVLCARIHSCQSGSNSEPVHHAKIGKIPFEFIQNLHTRI